METVRDRLWVWGHEAGSHNAGWNLPTPSRMTPAEGAFYLGVPKWLRQGRIEGMIFLASCICDLELEAVEWTRRWIAEVGGESV